MTTDDAKAIVEALNGLRNTIAWDAVAIATMLFSIVITIGLGRRK